MPYKDENKYEREGHSNLIHRQNAYKYIYLKNRDKYPLPFRQYQVHHIDGNKDHNHSSNLKLVTREEHEKIHGISSKDKEEGIDFSYCEDLIGKKTTKILLEITMWSVILSIAGIILSAIITQSDKHLPFVSVIWSITGVCILLLILFSFIGMIRSKIKK